MNYTMMLLTITIASLAINPYKVMAEVTTTTTTTTITTTSDTGTNSTATNTAITLGNPILIINDKTTNLRSVVVNSSKLLEISYVGNGTVKGSNFIDKGVDLIATKPDGAIYSQGRGNIMVKGSSERASYVFQAIGQYGPDGKLRESGAAFFSTNSTGKMVAVKDLVVVYKGETSRGGNIKTIGWEWK
ncbi:MAG TPA: hypothetical protein VE619_06015 [Nitrososphaeraceae archaeon]|nr:hypothetical protein [Nitrososphaeraceae archaeon]